MVKSRRDFLGAFAAAALVAPWLAASAQNDSDVPYSDPELRDKWLRQWLDSPTAVTGALHLGRFADPTYYTLKEITWLPSAEQGGLPTITVPAGFVTDLASIPRAFWSLLRPDGQYTFPAIVHDYLYWDQTTSRHEADLIFKYGMEDMRIEGAIVSVIHSAVRLGGGGPWSENQKLRSGGEKRMLALYPDDPTVTWAQWRVRPGVLR